MRSAMARGWAWVLVALSSLLDPASAACGLCGRRCRGGEGCFVSSARRGLLTRVALCASCWERIRFCHPPWCSRCGRPGPAEGLCPDCRRHRHLVSRLRAVGVYDGLWREAIHRLKYGGERQLAEPLGTLLAALVAADPVLASSQLMVPIPLHPTRLQQRGFNQAELLALEVAAQRRLAVSLGVLARGRATPPQTRLTGAERRRQLRGAFSVVDPALVRGRQVLLVDDVYTTGSTLDAAARALLQAGASRVVAACLAVALQPADLTWAGPARGWPGGRYGES